MVDITLALDGGGSIGYAQIGVFRALEQEGLLRDKRSSTLC